MPLNVPPSLSCPVPSFGARGFALTFPGGAKIGAMMSQLYATEAEIARSLLGQAQLVLAPMKPVFDLLAAVLAIVKILEAVTTLNPVAIADELKNAAKQFAALVQLLPQVSGPIMVGHLLDVVIRVLEGFVVELNQIVWQDEDIERLAQQILNENDPLVAVLDCARKINTVRLCAIDESMAPLGPIFQLLSIFLRLLGLPPIEALGALGHDAVGARTAVTNLILTLSALRQSLPIPPLAVTPRC